MNTEPKLPRNWQAHIDLARLFVNVNQLVNEHKTAQAADSLEHFKPVMLSSYEKDKIDEQIFAQKINVAYAGGQFRMGYKQLSKHYALMPTDKTREQMLAFAGKLRLDSAQVFKRIKYLRDSTAAMATDFSLKNYLTNNSVSLKDYRGKVILLTYWFPTCSPCRAEFPHLEKALKKVNSSHVVYLGLNSFTPQDDYVPQFVKTAGVSFIPLRDNRKSDKGNLENYNSAPENFLIDQNGKLVFSHFTITDKNERTLELMISETLKQ